MQNIILPLLLLGAMYALVMRPQQRRVRAHAALMSAVQVGDEIITVGGVFGRVIALYEDTMQVEIAPGVQVKMLRRMVMDRLSDSDPYEEDHDDHDGHDAGSPGELDDGEHA
jgi:preprotein translocase subunit YajC